MTFLSELYLPGAVTIWCAVFFALATLWGYAEVLQGNRSALSFARRGYTFFSLSIVLSAAVLLLSLLRRDFRIEYVYQYSGLDLPAHYQLAAFWAGQKGSFLIWLLWGALLGLLVRRTTGRHEPAVMGIYLLNLCGLLFILVRENPFVMLTETPADGAGLNPLLQDDWMVIHPPIMFVGYAAAAIPMAFAWAAMWQRETRDWATRAFPWALGGFLVLGTAILMGGYWAYKTLGWGGYWGWDPVENASLIPWMIGVVLIHGLYLERTRGRYRRLNLLLSCVLYLSVLYGTFLTRSGVLADFSVHSFVDLGITRFLIYWMAFFFAGSIYLLATRWRGIDTRANEDLFFSRGFFLMLGTIVVTVSTIVVALGTSAPLLTYFLENPGQVGPAFYNRVNMPLALLLAALMGMVPFLTWRGTPPRQLARKLAPAAVAGVVATAIALLAGARDLFSLVFVLFAATALASNLHKVVEMARGGALARTGGYLAHVGVGIMLLGILASSAYDHSTKVTLEQGTPQQVGDVTLTFNRFVPRQGWERESMEILVEGDDGSRHTVYPKLFVNDRTRQLMANPDILKTVMRDLYVSPIQYEPGSPPGVDHRVQLARGESATAGPLEIRFLDFDLSGAGADPAAQLASTGSVTIGGVLEVRRDGETATLRPLYRFAGGRVESPPTPLPGGGSLALTGIVPTQGAIQVDVVGVASRPQPAKLSIDVTRKPLIKLVWYGLYVVLAGGALATVRRLRASRKLSDSESQAVG